MDQTELKNQQNANSPEAFIESVSPPRRRADAEALLALFKRVTGMPAKMWGDSMVGFGRYRYRYASGREGMFFITGFSPRRANISIYILPGYRDFSNQLARLGKHKTGKSCLYINKLSDIDEAVLVEIVRNGIDSMREHYETWEV